MQVPENIRDITALKLKRGRAYHDNVTEHGEQSNFERASVHIISEVVVSQLLVYRVASR
jgi:hypothetical protein